jgi:hypothetical protein
VKVLYWLDNNQENEICNFTLHNEIYNFTIVQNAALFLFNWDERNVEKSKLPQYKAERQRCKTVVDDFYKWMKTK